MKLFFLIFTFCININFAQESKIKFDANKFIGVDNLENFYYSKNNVLHKTTNLKTSTYTNLHLGEIELVDITNPLKIVVFYKNFNSVIVLDDQLNELSNTIDFNTFLFKNISYVGTSSNANLWLFNKDNKELLLFNYHTKKVQFTKQLDYDFNFKTAINNYHNIWLISDTKVLKYNAYGSFIEEYNVKNIDKAIVANNKLIFKINNSLHYLTDTNELKLITTNKEININDFYFNNGFLYFFDLNYIYTQEFTKK